MKTYRNATSFEKCAECTQVRACTVEGEGTPVSGVEWVETDASAIEGLMQLWKIGNVRYYGRL